MKYRISTVILLIMTLFLLSLPVSATEQTVNRMTPYDTYADPDTFLNGAVLDLKKSGDVKGWITRELENMRYCFNIKKFNLVGLLRQSGKLSDSNKARYINKFSV